MNHKKQSFEWNGERCREESGWTWICLCGHTESASTKAEAHSEWMYHKESADRNRDAKPTNNDKSILDQALFKAVQMMDTDDLRSYVFELMKKKWHSMPVKEQDILIRRMNEY